MSRAGVTLVAITANVSPILPLIATVAILLDISRSARGGMKIDLLMPPFDFYASNRH